MKIIDSKIYKNRSELIKKLIEIDKICFPDLGELDEGDLEYWERNREASFCFVVMDRSLFIGYIDFLKITDQGFDEIKKGNTQDGDLERFLIKDHFIKEFYLYMVAVCILPEYQNKGLANMLCTTVQSHFNQEGLKIKGILTTIWTEEGKNLIKKFNLKKVGQDKYGHQIVLLRDF